MTQKSGLHLCFILLIVTSLVFSCYLFKNHVLATLTYDLDFDEIPVNFTEDRTLFLDTQTNDRAFLIYGDYLQIRSKYLTFYDLNNSFEHDDTNLVIGAYCYAKVPAQNATLNSITPIDRFELSSWNGTVTVSTTAYSTKTMTLVINSTEGASLLVHPMGLSWPHRYDVYIDGVKQSIQSHTDVNGCFDYNYSGPWSTHTLTFKDAGAPVIVPSIYLNIIQLFLILGLFVTVAKSMVLPVISKRNIPANVIAGNLIRTAIYIAMGTVMITLVFQLFIGG